MSAQEGCAAALRAAADAADGMHDPPAPDCHEWAEWLRARADRIAAAVTPNHTRATHVIAQWLAGEDLTDVRDGHRAAARDLLAALADSGLLLISDADDSHPDTPP